MTNTLNGVINEENKVISQNTEEVSVPQEIAESNNETSEIDAIISKDNTVYAETDSENMDEFSSSMLDEMLEEQDSTFDYSDLSEEELLAKLTEIINLPVETIVDQVENIKLNFYKKHKNDLERKKKAFVEAGGNIENYPYEESTLEVAFKSLLKTYRERKNEVNAKSEQEKLQNLEAKLQIVEELKELVNRQESINDTFQAFRALQNRWKDIGPVPQAKMSDLWENYHHHTEVFYNYIKINKELRDLDLKKNYDTKCKLCEQAEELVKETSVLKAFKALQKLHEQWREVGPVASELKADLWNRFKLATSALNKKHQEYFDALKEDQKKNLELKTVLCEKAEALCAEYPTTIQEWDKKSNIFAEIQKEWKTIGFAPKKDNTKIYNRFRATCDDFFGKKKVFFAQFKDEQSKNYQLKLNICEQVEALMDSTEWKSTTDKLIQLQKEWKEIGPVPRKSSDAIWKRFRAACDHFFNKKAEFFNDTHSKYNENLQQKRALIEEIIAFNPSGDINQSQETLKEFQRRWSAIGFVPIKHKDSILKQYREAINAKFDVLRKSNRSYRQDNKSESRFNYGSERDKLVAKLKHLDSEIVILENNIGFFSNSKNAKALIDEVKQRIEAHREEIKAIEDKVRKMDEAE